MIAVPVICRSGHRRRGGARRGPTTEFYERPKATGPDSGLKGLTPGDTRAQGRRGAAGVTGNAKTPGNPRVLRVPMLYESPALTVELQARVLIAAIVAYEPGLLSLPLDLLYVAQPRAGVKVGARQLGGETCG